MLESRGQRKGVTYPAQVFEKRLNSNGGKMLHDRNEQRSRAVFVLNQSLADSRLVGQIFCGVGENRRESFRTFDGLHEDFWRNRKQSFLSAGGDHFIRVMRKDGENFCAIGRIHVGRARTDGKLSLASRTAVFQVFYNFRGERFHRMPASNACRSLDYSTEGAGQYGPCNHLAVQFQQQCRGTLLSTVAFEFSPAVDSANNQANKQ